MAPRKQDGSFNAEWDVKLCSTCFEIPGSWCYAFWCPPCVSFMQRKKILNNDMSRYVCCGGFVCGECCRGCCKPCPSFCLCLEVICCFWCSVSGNRLYLQERWHIRNTKCENCLLWLACICSFVRCIVSIFVDIPQEIDCLIDLLYCMLQACMQSQQEHELKMREGNAPQLKTVTVVTTAQPGSQPYPAQPGYGQGPPPPQQSYPPPPNQGYPPPPNQGYPPPPNQGYPPPPNQGYPPPPNQGYPPPPNQGYPPPPGNQQYPPPPKY